MTTEAGALPPAETVVEKYYHCQAERWGTNGEAASTAVKPIWHTVDLEFVERE
jgi:hypothetical protein